MLPAVVANELQDAVRAFLRSAFPIATSYFQGGDEAQADAQYLIDELIQRPEALFKGPYLDVKLPFRQANDASSPFRHIELPFTPYQHQHKAFTRLAGDAPQSTIVATGTGSGKTECFMLPMLDDCLHRREPGIKALVIYPMNALATDQAKRFAREVAKLDTKLTVGLYVGGEQAHAEHSMGPDHVITDQKTLRDNPPDILLTNYKMLDFLLIRPRDQSLWQHNTPGMLRYLVVDELHTFDGAQGTDLACLIRRLCDRLDVGTELACVGTSATVGHDSQAELLQYATDVFATDFDTDAVVLEDRQSADEYLLGATAEQQARSRETVDCFTWPDGRDGALDPRQYRSVDAYLQQQIQLWFGEAVEDSLPDLTASDERERAEATVALGALLRRHIAFHELVRATESLTNISELAATWQTRFSLPDIEQAEAVIASLLSLVAAARTWLQPEHDAPDEWCQPFLQMRAQLWLRELRRMVCAVPAAGEQPSLAFADDLQDPLQPLHLPLLHCRDCHLAAWGAVAKQGDGQHLDGDLQNFYQAWFQNNPQTRLLVPQGGGAESQGHVQAFCRHCLRLQPRGKDNTCSQCEADDVVPVWVPDMLRKSSGDGPPRASHDCPECGARDSLFVLGYRAATLTSVMVGRLFATPYNDDHKLIAFSDSVQDAAHRAGFLGANTWRQVVRRAMSHWLAQQTVSQSLQAMSERLPDDWRKRIAHDGRFCGLFIPPNMAWMREYDELQDKGRLPAGSQLPDDIAKRLHWECLAEFGRRSGVGRSLERTGSASIALDVPRLREAVGAVAAQLREEVEALRGLGDGMLTHFTLGWLHHLRQIGAIYDLVLDGYLNNKGKEYLLNRVPWMPGFGRSRRPPAAVSLGHLAPNFEALVLSGRETWSVGWLKKTLADEHVFAAAESRQIFQRLLAELTRAGWLVERTVAGEPVYLLNPERLLVSAQSAAAVCDSCRHPLHFAPEMADAYTGLCCLRSRCLGRLELIANTCSHSDYTGDGPRRLVPHEHTGLLERDVRESVEQSFIHGFEPWDVNLLSATPTLEMGIDIGDLSSVLLCSVPPAQANYLQRIGRAGRRDGNALAVTVANGQNHDLYFYSEPREMMAGAVHTPGVFLQARAVLERQLLAYCFDRWAATGIDETAIPGKLGKVLDNVTQQRTDGFPYNLLRYITSHQGDVLAGFFGLFPELGADDRQYLETFLYGDAAPAGGAGGGQALEWRLVNRLSELAEQCEGLRKKANRLKAERERLQKLPQDEAIKADIEEMTRERSAVLELRRKLTDQPVLNFFTDEGLLPNYAFPEEGVTLHSVILRRRNEAQIKAGDSAYEKTAYSFQRPAQAALSELAPENRFYAVSHELPIDQVDLSLSRTEQWRFCNRCQYNESVELSDAHSACPQCGSPQWADSGQKRTVLRLRQVYSTVNARDSRIGDDSEQRQPQFFNRQMLVNTPPEGRAGGFRLPSESLPFGFEFLRRAIFREVNFGVAGGEANTFAVAGQEKSRQGFRICAHCGTVQKAKPRKGEPLHGFTCKLRKHPEQASVEDYFDSLYLYRELESEAIRILLPLSEVAYSDEKLHSFIAALNLGLRAYFHGDVHHLEVTDMHEPGVASGGERVYLVIYDRIPGGTGYLKELMREPDNLMQVLALAHDRLTTCDCIDDEGRDGCYRCILAYRDARNMPTISRAGAAELLAQILAWRQQLVPVQALSDIDTNALVESQLEQRFIDALAALPGAQMSQQLVRGKPANLLTLPGADGRPVPWHVEHQVKVGPPEHVARQTEIDVLLTPARSEAAERYRPIAVYLDGLQYHHDRVADDVCKRTALLQSGRFWVFSLTWDDVPAVGQAAKGYDPDLLCLHGSYHDALRGIYDGLAAQADWRSSARCTASLQQGAMVRLDGLLRDPERTLSGAPETATFRGLTTLQPPAVKDTALLEKLAYELGKNAPPSLVEAFAFNGGESVPGGFMAALDNTLPGIEVTCALPVDAMRQQDGGQILNRLRVHLCFDDRDTEPTDRFKAAWRALWHAANLLQFLPGFSMASRQSVVDGTLESVWTAAQAYAAQAEEERAASQQETAWGSVFEESLLEPDEIQQLMALDLPEPEVGVDLADESGAIVVGGDIVELCWRDARVAVVTDTVSQALPSWRFVEWNAETVSHLERLKSEGVF